MELAGAELAGAATAVRCMASGETLPADKVFWCTGGRPNTGFLHRPAQEEDGEDGRGLGLAAVGLHVGVPTPHSAANILSASATETPK